MRPLLRPALLVFLAALAARLTAQPANVQADPTTGALFRPSAATFISGNNLASATGGIVLGANGGTGVANTGKTLTLGGNVTTSGAFGLTLTLTAASAVTLPTTGTLATLAGSETLTNKTLTSPTLTTPTLGAATATSLTLSGNISSSAWTTSGVRLKGVAATLTDTTSTGTVAAAYTDVLGGNTIAASNATTFTDYITAFFKEPTAGSLVTMTNKWALGGESLRIGTSTPMTVSTAGAITANSLTASASTALTLTGGSTGASLVLGATGGGTATLNRALTATKYTYPDDGSAVFSMGRYSAGVPTAFFQTPSTGTNYGWLNSAASELMRLTSTGNLLIGTTTDAANLSGGLIVNGSGTAAAASSTTTGALRVTGGVGVSGAGYFGGALNTASTLTVGGAITGPTTGDLTFNGGTGRGVTFNPAAGADATMALSGGAQFRITGATGGLILSGTTASTSTSTGALQVAGGVGVSGAGYFGGVGVFGPVNTGASQYQSGAFYAGSNADNSGTYIDVALQSGTSTGARLYGGRWASADRGARLVSRNSVGTEKSYLHLNAESDTAALYNSSGQGLLIASTGAATFAGAVTVASTVQVGTVLRVGGATADFPGLRNTGAQLDVVTASNTAWADIAAAQFKQSDNGISWSSGTGSPEGVKTAPVGSLYSRTDGGASTTLYVKQSGVGNTGWVAK